MKIAIVLYPNFTALDCIGPYEVMSQWPGATVRFVSADGGAVTADSGTLKIMTEAKLSDTSTPDIVLVPGGPGDEAAAADERVTTWLKKVHEATRYTTSVCTGSLILAAAGLLDAKEATTHWARHERLGELGATPVKARMVRAGKIITAAGVSAGIDMALELTREVFGDDYAQALQLGIEYDPAPPFDAGSPDKVSAEIVQLVRAAIEDNPARKRAAG